MFNGHSVTVSLQLRSVTFKSELMPWALNAPFLARTTSCLLQKRLVQSFLSLGRLRATSVADIYIYIYIYVCVHVYLYLGTHFFCGEAGRESHGRSAGANILTPNPHQRSFKAWRLQKIDLDHIGVLRSVCLF